VIRFRELPAWVLVSLCAWCLAGIAACQQGLSPNDIHEITQEIARAARGASPQNAAIRMRKTATSDPASYDSVAVDLHSDPAGARAATARMLQRVSTVLSRHRLTEDPPEMTGAVIRVRIRSGNRQTHELLIEQPSFEGGTEHPKVSGAPRLAIILDDLGSDRVAADHIFQLSQAVTVSVLPGHQHSTEIAEQARQHGLEVMLHLPMQALGGESREPLELRPGMNREKVAATLNELLKAVPGATGVNNHQGSQATRDRQLMEELMPEIRAHGLFYIDSRTTKETVAYEAAQTAGVRSGFRNVPFLDDVTEVAAIRRQVALAVRGAKEKGQAIAIGHPHPETLEVLKQELPRIVASGVQIVPASELVQ
jgi:uncharacterized protein